MSEARSTSSLRLKSATKPKEMGPYWSKAEQSPQDQQNFTEVFSWGNDKSGQLGLG